MGWKIGGLFVGVLSANRVIIGQKPHFETLSQSAAFGREWLESCRWGEAESRINDPQRTLFLQELYTFRIFNPSTD